MNQDGLDQLNYMLIQCKYQWGIFNVSLKKHRQWAKKMIFSVWSWHGIGKTIWKRTFTCRGSIKQYLTCPSTILFSKLLSLTFFNSIILFMIKKIYFKECSLKSVKQDPFLIQNFI